MSLPQDLDLIDLEILKSIAASVQDASARQIQSAVFLSRSQVLRRLARLEQRGLVIKRNGIGRAYRFVLGPSVTLQDIEPRRLVRDSDSVSQEIRAIIDRLTEVVRRMEEGTLR